MYNQLKKIVKTILPTKILVGNEFLFRSMMIPFYKGNNHQCNVCETKLKRFAILGNGELICPICGSLPRARRLYMLLKDELIKPEMHILDFSPFRILYKKLKGRKDIHYYPSDWEDDFIADYQYDMRDIDAENEKFDLIICYHILEHIIEDETAMKELYRVLKIDGSVIIQTPFKEGDIYENFEIVTPAERLLHFGQDNHVRIYSIEGLEQRLKNVGFKTKIRIFQPDNFLGLQGNEKLIICTK